MTPDWGGKHRVEVTSSGKIYNDFSLEFGKLLGSLKGKPFFSIIASNKLVL